jgi:hypothetical protein
VHFQCDKLYAPAASSAIPVPSNSAFPRHCTYWGQSFPHIRRCSRANPMITNENTSEIGLFCGEFGHERHSATVSEFLMQQMSAAERAFCDMARDRRPEGPGCCLDRQLRHLMLFRLFLCEGSLYQRFCEFSPNSIHSQISQRVRYCLWINLQTLEKSADDQNLLKI